MLIPLIKRALEFHPGNIIFSEGDSGTAAFIVQQGYVEVLKGGMHIAVLGTGEIFGEMSGITGEPRSATVRAKTHVRVMRLDARTNYEFLNLVSQRPELAKKVIEQLAQRLRKTTTALVEEAHSRHAPMLPIHP